MDHILVAARGEVAGGAWTDEVIVALRDVSKLLSDAAGRVRSDHNAVMAFDHSPVGIALVSKAGMVRSANQALGELLGVHRIDDLLGAHLSDFFFDPAGSQPWSSEGDIETLRTRLVSRDRGPWLADIQCRPVAAKEPREWLTHIADVTEQDRAGAQLQHAATHDVLTGLSNRRALLEAMAEHVHEDHTSALVVLDLDHFKIVNDTMGHGAGDSLLVAIAKRLTHAARAADLVVRMGGDEFGIYVSGPTSAADIEALADCLLGVLSQAELLEGQHIRATASIGSSLAPASHSDQLLVTADQAMYRAKQTGGARHVAFDDGLARSIDARNRTETSLRVALGGDQIEVAYQPVVDLATRELVGAEALMRWRRPEGELIDAAEFVDVAEQSGLIVPIGRHILQVACAEAARWTGDEDPSGLTVRVNLSARELRDPGLVAEVRAVLRRTRLDPSNLCLEVSESASMIDTARSEASLQELRALGVGLAVDDFGTGDSSFGYLKRLPFTGLKVDKSFVHALETDPGSAKFVSAIVALAAALDLMVVAEGVETEAQALALIDLGCRNGQGHLFGAPLPIDALQTRIASR